MTTETFYMITSAQIARLKAVATRLYSENRLNGDEMRDLAHALSAVAKDCSELPLPPASSDHP